MRADSSAGAFYGGVLIRSRSPTSRPAAKVGKYSNPGRQDAPWGKPGETNGRTGPDWPSAQGAGDRPQGPAIYANGNYGFVYHRDGVARAMTKQKNLMKTLPSFL